MSTVILAHSTLTPENRNFKPMTTFYEHSNIFPLYMESLVILIDKWVLPSNINTRNFWITVKHQFKELLDSRCTSITITQVDTADKYI
jgi:hypothetical protein